MEPKRVLIVEPVTLTDGQLLQRWTYVWELCKESDGTVLIEHRNREYKIPASHTVATPVPEPAKDSLLALDPCFADVKKDLLEVHRNEPGWFSVCRCPHDNYFLEDVRGGMGMFSIWIFLGPVKDPSTDHWESLWKKYHYIPVDAIYHLGLGCS